MGDHTEVLQVDYNPAEITYEEILDLFWSWHNPDAVPWSRQYMAMILFHDENQEMIALQTRDSVAKKLEAEVNTEVAPLVQFYPAEDYHQKYYLQNFPQLADEIKAYYPEFAGFVDSTAAARLNGLLAGFGDGEQEDTEIDRYGLSEEGKRLLLQALR